MGSQLQAAPGPGQAELALEAAAEPRPVLATRVEPAPQLLVAARWEAPVVLVRQAGPELVLALRYR